MKQVNEREQAQILAAAVLDRPNADPDDDVALLARQLQQALEEIEQLKAGALEIHEKYERVSNEMREENHTLNIKIVSLQKQLVSLKNAFDEGNPSDKIRIERLTAEIEQWESVYGSRV